MLQILANVKKLLVEKADNGEDDFGPDNLSERHDWHVLDLPFLI